MTKRISSEDCEGKTVVVPDGRYLKHGVEVSKEADPGYEEIDYTDCTEITVPSGRYVKHVVDVGGGGSGSGGDIGDHNHHDEHYTKVEINQKFENYYDKGQIDEKLENITTEDVNTVGTFRVDLPTQKEVNHYLDQKIQELEAGAGTEIIWYNEGPPGVDDGEYEFWFHTERLELLIKYNDQWWPVSIPPEIVDEVNASLAELKRDTMLNKQATDQLRRDIAAGDFRPDLEQVLKQGNVASTGATFGGRVKVEPGREGHDAVTYEQLAGLEEEIEQLVPTSERGAWDFKMTCLDLDGEFCMTTVETQDQYDKKKSALDVELTQCLAAASGDPTAQSDCYRVYDEKLEALVNPGTLYNTDDFSLVTKITFSGIDSTGTIHNFSNVEVGQIVDMLSDEGDYMVGEVTEVPGGLWYENHTLGVKVTSFKGKARGRCRIKIFSPGGLDPNELDSYVRKAGDDMTGPLHIKADTSDSNPAFLLEPDNTSSSYSDIMQVRNNEGTLLFYVTNGGTVSSGGSSGYKPSADHHLATKKYVDDQDLIFKPARYGWKVSKNTDKTPMQGYVSCSKGRIDGGASFRFSLKSMTGGLNMLKYSPTGGATAKEIYRYSGSSGAMTAMTLTCWVYQSGGTQMWKGTGEVREILLKEEYLQVTLNSHTDNNGADFDSSSIYHFTIGGFF